MMKSVPAPKGFHWMKTGKTTYKLMKTKGVYKPHKGASKAAKFSVMMKHKNAK